VALDACAVQAINVTLVVTPTFKWALISFKVGLDYFFKRAVIYTSQGPKQRFFGGGNSPKREKKGCWRNPFFPKWIEKKSLPYFDLSEA
jgi:hypothetical protein